MKRAKSHVLRAIHSYKCQKLLTQHSKRPESSGSVLPHALIFRSTIPTVCSFLQLTTDFIWFKATSKNDSMGMRRTRTLDDGSPLNRHTCVVACNLQLVEHSVRFPPPVVLGLCELCLSVMAIQVRVQCVVTQHFLCPGHRLHDNQIQ
jgi:hypothetical protein